MLPCKRADGEGVEAVDAGLVQMREEVAEQALRDLCIKAHLMIIRTEVRCAAPGDGAFVGVRIIHCDGEGFDALMTGGVGEREDRGGINAAAEEDADRHIADKMMAHAVEQCFACGRDGIAVEGAAFGKTELPESLSCDLSILPQKRPACLQAFRFVDQRERFRDGAGLEIALHRLGAERWSEELALAQGPQLGGIGERLAMLMKIERLDAKGVTGERTCPFAGVPDGKGKHAPQPFGAVDAMSFIEAQNDLGVGAGAEADAFVLQAFPQSVEVVNFTIERDRESPVRRAHRLPRGAAEIKDGEPLMGQRGLTIRRLPEPLIIRPTMPERILHTLRSRLSKGRIKRDAEDSGDAAHVNGLPVDG